MKPFYRILFFAFTMTTLSGCFRDNQRVASRELFKNKMDFNYSNCLNIKYGGLHFKLPKKFKKEYYLSVNTNGSKCLTYSIEELSLYFSISEVKEKEASNIRYLNRENNTLQAIQSDAVLKRKKSISIKAKSSESKRLNYNYSFIFQTVTEPYTKEYEWDTNSNSIYYVATLKKNERYYVIQFTGRGENLCYLLDDFKRILKTFK